MQANLIVQLRQMGIACVCVQIISLLNLSCYSGTTQIEVSAAASEYFLQKFAEQQKISSLNNCQALKGYLEKYYLRLVLNLSRFCKQRFETKKTSAKSCKISCVKNPPGIAKKFIFLFDNFQLINIL